MSEAPHASGTANLLAALRKSGLGYDLVAMTEEDLDRCVRACAVGGGADDELRPVRADLDRERFRRWAWRAVEAYAELAGCGEAEARSALRTSRDAMAEAFRAGFSAPDAVLSFFNLRPGEGLEDDDPA